MATVRLRGDSRVIASYWMTSDMYTADKAREATNNELDDILRDIVSDHPNRTAGWLIGNNVYPEFTPIDAVNGIIERGFKVRIVEVTPTFIHIEFSW